MKRFLLTAVLILAVITSLTAGTLAAYNKTLSIPEDFHAKKFFFTADGDELFGTTFYIAPGDKRTYWVYVSQDTEVPVDYTVTSELTGDAELLGRLTKSVTLYNNCGENLYLGNSFTVQKDAGRKSYVFTIKLDWNDTGEDEKDVDAIGHKVKLTVTINGKQHI